MMRTVPSPSRRPRRPALGPAVVLAVVLIGGGLFAVLGGDDATDDATDDRLDDPLTIEPPGVEEGPDEPPPLEDDLAAYRIVYRVEATAEGGSIVDTEVREVRRPFEARGETLTGEPPGDELTALSIWAFGVTEIGSPDQARAALVGEPQLPNGEVGLAQDIDAAVDDGVLVYLGEQQELADRTCYRYRTGGPVDVVLLTAPTSTDFADLCIDRAGLVLGETWVVDGKPFRRRTAVEVDTDPNFADDAFEHLGRPPSFRDGGGLIGEVTPDSQFPDVDHWALPAPPAGFELRGRFSFTPAQAGDAAEELGSEASVVTGLSDVYESGGNTIIVVNGGSNDQRDVLGGLSGDTVDVGDLGEAYVRRRVRGAELLVRLPEGRFVKIVGTLAVADLVAVGRDLERLDGTGKTITAEPGGEDLPRPGS